jgi:hypothetical protein
LKFFNFSYKTHFKKTHVFDSIENNLPHESVNSKLFLNYFISKGKKKKVFKILNNSLQNFFITIKKNNDNPFLINKFTIINALILKSISLYDIVQIKTKKTKKTKKRKENKNNYKIKFNNKNIRFKRSMQ